MSTATVTMTPEQAEQFRKHYDAKARWLAQMSMAGVSRENAIALADHGRVRLFGKPSRDEMEREVMDLRGYTIERLNEAIHVLHHDVVWPDCLFCAGSAS